MRRAMVEDRESRVDFGMAEALAFGTLALHRGVRPPQAPQGAQQASAGEDPRSSAQRGMHDQSPDTAILSWHIRSAEAHGDRGRLLECPSWPPTFQYPCLFSFVYCMQPCTTWRSSEV